MEWDAQVTVWLDSVLAGLRATGLADLVERTVAGVWVRNVDRYDPVVAGDSVEHQTGQFWWPGLAPGTGDDPSRLRHLVLVWSGDPVTATTAGRLGVPYAGPPGSAPWLAVATVWQHRPDDVPRPPEPVIAVPRARPSPDLRAPG